MVHPLLREENIIPRLQALSCADALGKVVQALPNSNLSRLEKPRILEQLLLREEMGTTAIGQGIALPHCFSAYVQKPLIAFAVSPGGIPYPSLDGRPVHFIFLLILPSGEEGERQKRQILQNIKWVLCDRYMQERLKSAHTAAQILQLVVPAPRQMATVGA